MTILDAVMTFFRNVVILCLLWEAVFARDCPCDYEITLPLTRVGEKFYYIESNTQANWFSASNFCHLHKMRLASIASELEQHDLKQHLQKTKLNVTGFWTSGSDLAKQGHWIWTSYGTRISYTNWNPTEPNNHGEDEHCLEISANDIMGWNDIECEQMNYFICETWG